MLHARHVVIGQIPDLGKDLAGGAVWVPAVDGLEAGGEDLTPAPLSVAELGPPLSALALRVPGIAVAILQHVSAKDDEPARPHGVFGRVEGAEGGAAFEWEGEGPLLHEGRVDFLAEEDPEGGLAEADWAGEGGDWVDKDGRGDCDVG